MNDIFPIKWLVDGAVPIVAQRAPNADRIFQFSDGAMETVRNGKWQQEEARQSVLIQFFHVIEGGGITLLDAFGMARHDRLEPYEAVNTCAVSRDDAVKLLDACGLDDEVLDAEPEKPVPQKTDSHSEDDLAALFDPVGISQLEKMFPNDGRWKSHTEHAKARGLDVARISRGKYNPYLAAQWWINRKPPAGWDWARCLRVLVNNLPDRSRDSSHLLDGKIG